MKVASRNRYGKRLGDQGLPQLLDLLAQGGRHPAHLRMAYPFTYQRLGDGPTSRVEAPDTYAATIPLSISDDRRRYLPSTSAAEPFSRVRGTATSIWPIVVSNLRR